MFNVTVSSQTAGTLYSLGGSTGEVWLHQDMSLQTALEIVDSLIAKSHIQTHKKRLAWNRFFHCCTVDEDTPRTAVSVVCRADYQGRHSSRHL